MTTKKRVAWIRVMVKREGEEGENRICTDGLWQLRPHRNRVGAASKTFSNVNHQIKERIFGELILTDKTSNLESTHTHLTVCRKVIWDQNVQTYFWVPEVRAILRLSVLELSINSSELLGSLNTRFAYSHYNSKHCL